MRMTASKGQFFYVFQYGSSKEKPSLNSKTTYPT